MLAGQACMPQNSALQGAPVFLVVRGLGPFNNSFPGRISWLLKHILGVLEPEKDVPSGSSNRDQALKKGPQNYICMTLN